MSQELGSKENPWHLKTPPLSSDFTMHKDIKEGKEVLVCTVGKTVLHYDYRCIADLAAMLKKHGDWMELGSADEQKPVKEGTVEEWGRSEKIRQEAGTDSKKDLADDLPCRCRR